MSTENKLKLYRLADRLASFTIDNGPMGEQRPFAREAEELRAIAGEQESTPVVHVLNNPFGRSSHGSRKS